MQHFFSSAVFQGFNGEHGWMACGIPLFLYSHFVYIQSRFSFPTIPDELQPEFREAGTLHWIYKFIVNKRCNMVCNLLPMLLCLLIALAPPFEKHFTLLISDQPRSAVEFPFLFSLQMGLIIWD